MSYLILTLTLWVEHNYSYNINEETESDTATENNDEKDKKEEKDFKDLNFGIAKVSEVKSIDAVVDFKVLAELLGIGVILTLLSSLASIVAIARFSPLQILKERG